MLVFDSILLPDHLTIELIAAELVYTHTLHSLGQSFMWGHCIHIVSHKVPNTFQMKFNVLYKHSYRTKTGKILFTYCWVTHMYNIIKTIVQCRTDSMNFTPIGEPHVSCIHSMCCVVYSYFLILYFYRCSFLILPSLFVSINSFDSIFFSPP